MAKENDNSANQIPEGGAQDAANQPAEGGAQQPANQTLEGGAQDTVSKAALIAEQKKRQEAQAQAELLQQQLMLLQQQGPAQSPQASQAPDDMDYPTYGDLRREGAVLMQQMELQAFRGQHPDVDDVVGRAQGRFFQPSETFRKVLINNPHLSGLDQGVASGNPKALAAAYELVKRQQEVDELRAYKQSQEEHNKLTQDVTTAPMSTAAIGGAGGVSQQAQIPEMNTPEGDQLWADIKAGKYDRRQ